LLALRFSFIIAFCCTFLPSVFSQKVEVNVEGERIVRFDDGSWRYYEPADSIYELQFSGPKASRAKPVEGDKLETQKKKLEKALHEIERKIYSLRERRKEINQLLIETDNTQQIIELNTELQTVIRSERQNEQLYIDLTNELENIEKISSMRPDQRNKVTGTTSSTTVKNGVIEYNAEREVPVISDYIFTPALECKVNKERDEMSKLVTTQVASELIFSYTPEGVSSYLQEREYLEGYVHLTHVQGRFFLSLRVEIANMKAQQSYGYLAKNGQLILQLLNGETYALRNTSNSIGTVLPSEEITRYEAEYAIDPRVLNELEKNPLDKIRLVWSTGYEDYEVFDVDLLSRQFKCLSSNL